MDNAKKTGLFKVFRLGFKLAPNIKVNNNDIQTIQLKSTSFLKNPQVKCKVSVILSKHSES